MAQTNTKDLTTLPVGRLGLIPLESCRPLGEKVNEWLVKWRNERNHEEMNSFAFEGYQRDSYIINVKTPRFGTGESKGEISESVRGDDVYLMVDVCNHSLSYRINGFTNLMSPDDHFQDLKRAIAAIGGKARRVNVIMPYLYESRQSKRVGRESLDCASALQELTNMGVENIITFDAHDARVQNATPLHGFETIQPAYQFMKALLKNEKGLHIDNDHFMIISPDEGSMNRAIYLANVLGVDMGMYYRRLDYTRTVKGRHPIAAYEFLGPKLEGKDMILIDDMISSGDSILEIASLLKKRGAGRIFICATFGLFTDGLEKFDQAHKEGIFDRLLTTNLIYQAPELVSRPYYINCDMSKYIALIIDTLNHDMSVSHLLNPVDRIKRCVSNYMAQYDK
nr:ribose-phosphate pyrophosphokinase [uncultured Blautia sp.]